MTNPTTDSILYALFCLSRDTQHIDATELGRAVGVSTTEAARALVALEQAGLVDATRARLTMLGLARASALQAGGAGGPRKEVDLRHARPRKPAAQVPLAARSSAGGSLVHGRQERRVDVVLGVGRALQRAEHDTAVGVVLDARM
jgi:DNA-binding IclR family transcriptional regulator